ISIDVDLYKTGYYSCNCDQINLGRDASNNRTHNTSATVTDVVSTGYDYGFISSDNGINWTWVNNDISDPRTGKWTITNPPPETTWVLALYQSPTTEPLGTTVTNTAT